MKNIVFVTSAMGRGGTERVISILGDEFIRRGYKVSIVMTLHSVIGYDISKEIEVIDISNDRANRFFYLPQLLIKLRKVFKTKEPVLILAFLDINAFFSCASSFGIKKTLISSERNDPSKVDSLIYRKMYKWAYRHSNAVVLQTNKVKGMFDHVIQNKCTIIGNPIKINCNPVCNKEKRIVTAGRLEKQKNHRLLIKAFSLIAEQFPDYSLEIYGDGSLKNELYVQIEELGLKNRVLLCGNSNRLHEEIASATLFVLSSDFEGLSNALLESMMLGIPVVSTRCTGSDEIVEDGVNGLLAEVGNAQQLANKMKRLLIDEELRNSCINHAYDTVKKYSVENIVTKWESLFI